MWPRLGEVEVPGPLVVGGVETVERHHEVTQLLRGHQSLVIMEAEVIPEQAYHCPQLGHGSEIRSTIYWQGKPQLQLKLNKRQNYSRRYIKEDTHE